MNRSIFRSPRLLWLCTCVLAPLIGFAQTNPPRSYGESTVRDATVRLGVEDVQALDQLMFFIPGIGSPSREELVRQNIKSYMMPIRQATTASMEWAYALAGCLEYYVNLNNNFKDNLSPDYLTLSLSQRGSRPTLKDGLDLLVQQGTVSAAIVPFGSTVIPNSVYSVPRHAIANYGYLFRPETRARNRVFEVRKALSRGNPVLVELGTGADFARLRTTTYQPPAGAAAETHYLTVVGYDAETETFELRGNFGRLWANAGYVRLTYDDFGRLARTGYVLIPKA